MDELQITPNSSKDLEFGPFGPDELIAWIPCSY